MTTVEAAELDVIIQKLQNKGSYHSTTFLQQQFNLINKLLHWPMEFLGPVLNLLRVFVLHPSAAQTYSQQIAGNTKVKDDVVSLILQVISSTDKPLIAMLGLRIITNFFARRVLSRSIGARCEEVFDAAFSAIKGWEDENLRATVLALYINYSVLFIEDSKFYESGKVQLLSSLPEHFSLNNLNAKLAYTLIVVLGTLVYDDVTLTELAAALELPAVVQQITLRFPGDSNLQEAGKEAITAINSK